MNSPYGPPPEFSMPVAEVEPVAARPRSRWKVWVAVVAVLALAMALTGVLLGRSDGKSAIAILESAPANTTGAGTAQFSSAIRVTADGETHRFDLIQGKANFRAKTAQLDFAGRGFREQVRVVDGTEYLSQNAVDLPDGAEWVRIDPTDLGITAGRASFGSGDPSSGLQFLSAIIGDPQVVGDTTFDGTKATHYTFTLDLSDVTKLMQNAEDKVGASEIAEGIEKLSHATDLHHVPGEAWIDGDGRVFRLQYTLNLTLEGRSASETTMLDFSHFGEPVEVTAPPADRVIPFSRVPDLFARMQASALRQSGA